MPKIYEVHDRLETLDGVADQFKSLYVEAEGGGFVYKDPKALKESMVNAKGEKTQLATKLQELEAKYKGVDPEEYVTLKSKAKDFENIDKVKQGELDQIKRDLESRFTGQISERDKKIVERDTRYANHILGSQITAALSKAGISQKGVNLLSSSIRSAVTTKMGDDGEPDFRILDAKGSQRLNENADPYTIDDLVAEAKKEYPELFNSNAGSGGGSGGGDKNVQAPSDVSRILEWDDATKKAWINANGHDRYRQAFIKAQTAAAEEAKAKRKTA